MTRVVGGRESTVRDKIKVIIEEHPAVKTLIQKDWICPNCGNETSYQFSLPSEPWMHICINCEAIYTK